MHTSNSNKSRIIIHHYSYHVIDVERVKGYDAKSFLYTSAIFWIDDLRDDCLKQTVTVFKGKLKTDLFNSCLSTATQPHSSLYISLHCLYLYIILITVYFFCILKLLFYMYE